ncbi:hypothetical protein pb186bvf_014956 [Paramecium bursaria]
MNRLLLNFKPQEWVQGIGKYEIDIMIKSYQQNFNTFNQEHIFQASKIIDNNEYNRKIARLIHHSVMSNIVKSDFEQFLIDLQLLTMKQIMQKDNFIEILDKLELSVPQPVPLHIKRIYMEENLRIF